MNLIDNDDVNYIDLNLQNIVNSKDLNDKNYKEKKKYNHGNKAFEEMLIDFQNFLKDKKMIEGDDDNFKEMARQFIKSRKVVTKKIIKPTVVNSSNECDHDYRHGFNLIEGSFTWCAKCKQRF
jgi:hypothetical protein